MTEFFELYDLEDEEDNYESNTIGGWATEQYGGIPPIGEVLRLKNVEIKIVKATKQKVLKVRSKQCDDFEEAEYDESDNGKNRKISKENGKNNA